jgi:transcriptional regulator with XRE-family HTH domain
MIATQQHLVFDKGSIERLARTFAVNASQIAAKAGLKRQRVQQWLDGTCRPNAEALAALHNAYGVPLSFFYREIS